MIEGESFAEFGFEAVLVVGWPWRGRRVTVGEGGATKSGEEKRACDVSSPGHTGAKGCLDLKVGDTLFTHKPRSRRNQRISC